MYKGGGKESTGRRASWHGRARSAEGVRCWQGTRGLNPAQGGTGESWAREDTSPPRQGKRGDRWGPDCNIMGMVARNEELFHGYWFLFSQWTRRQAYLPGMFSPSFSTEVSPVLTMSTQNLGASATLFHGTLVSAYNLIQLAIM